MREIVLLPGFMCDSGLWELMRPDLKTLGRLHFPDTTRARSIDALASLALKEVPEKVTVIGFSMGGFIAREMALQAPDRVEALALLNTSARASGDKIAKRNAMLIAHAEKNGFQGLSDSALRTAVHPDREEDQDLRARISETAKRIGAEGFINQLSCARKDGIPELSKITCPSLVVWSDGDRLRSEAEAHELRDGLAKADYRVIKNVGHMTPLEAPDVLFEILKAWLGRIEALA